MIAFINSFDKIMIQTKDPKTFSKQKKPYVTFNDL